MFGSDSLSKSFSLFAHFEEYFYSKVSVLCIFSLLYNYYLRNVVHAHVRLHDARVVMVTHCVFAESFAITCSHHYV